MKVSFLWVGASSLAFGFLVACGSSSSSGKGAAADGGVLEDGGGDLLTDAATNGNDASLGNAADSGGASDASSGAGGDDSGTGSGSDSGTTTATPTGAHMTGLSITVNGTARTYDLTLPLTCDATTKVPVIFLFHADGGRGSDMYNGFALESAAATAGKDAVYVYPNGLDNNENGSAWNIYDDPGAFPYTKVSPTGNEDVDFFDAMMTAFAATPCADLTRVFITGFSNGGYMSEQLARWRASVVKASAPQSGGAPSGTASSDYPTGPCPGTTGAVPMMIIHGQSDGVVDPTLAEQASSYWDIANSCTDSAQDCSNSSNMLVAPQLTPTTAVTPSPCVSSNGCATGEPVIFCFIPGLGHDFWSDAPTAVWAFFSSIAGD